jgi:hypothetical protein
METVPSSEISVRFRLHGATSQKTAGSLLGVKSDWEANGEEAYIWQAAAEGSDVLSMHSTFGNEKTPTTVD